MNNPGQSELSKSVPTGIERACERAVVSLICISLIQLRLNILAALACAHSNMSSNAAVLDTLLSAQKA